MLSSGAQKQHPWYQIVIKNPTPYQNITLSDTKYCFIISDTLKWKITKKVIVSEAQRRIGANAVQSLYFRAREPWGGGHEPADTSWSAGSLLRCCRSGGVNRRGLPLPRVD